MKKILCYLAVSAVAAFFFVSCSSEKEFNKEFLYDGTGKWVSYNFIEGHTVYFVFKADGSAKRWDETDDQKESEATPMKWSMSGERYSYQSWMEITNDWGATSDFTIIDLTASKFQYQNASGRTYLLQK